MRLIKKKLKDKLFDYWWTILARIVHNTACWLTPCWVANNHFLLLHWLLQHEPVFESVKQLVAGADWTESLRVTQSPMSSWSHQINSCKSSVSQFFGLSCKWDSPWSCSAGPGWSGSRHPQCSFVTHWQLEDNGGKISGSSGDSSCLMTLGVSSVSGSGLAGGWNLLNND